MKTAYDIKAARDLLHGLQLDVRMITSLVEGHTSQVFQFQIGDRRYVLRIRAGMKDLLADKYAYDHFSNILPVPSFLRLGLFEDDAYYSITEYIQGQTVNVLSGTAFQHYLPAIRQKLATTFRADISKTVGYGNVDFSTGNAQHPTWKTALQKELADLNVDHLRRSARNIKLPNDIVDQFVAQFHTNLPYVSETRRLLHGDPGEDNMLVEGGKIVALLDWEQMAYGDWMRDFSRFGFWEKKKYGDAREFAEEFQLEAENSKQRIAVYWAIDALRNIEFADRYKNEKVASWMREHAKDKIVD